MTARERALDFVVGVSLAVSASAVVWFALRIDAAVPLLVRVFTAAAGTLVAAHSVQLAGRLIGRAVRGR